MWEARGWLPKAQRGRCFKKKGRSAPSKLPRGRMGTAKGPFGLVIGGMARITAEAGPAEDNGGKDTDTGKTETCICRSVWRNA